jgi:hypothetical protein
MPGVRQEEEKIGKGEEGAMGQGDNLTRRWARSRK